MAVPAARESIARPGQGRAGIGWRLFHTCEFLRPRPATPGNCFSELRRASPVFLGETNGSPLAIQRTHDAIDLAAIDPLTSRIIKCGVEVHRRLGPGLLESVYHVCLAFELRAAGLTVVENMPVPVCYKDHQVRLRLPKADFLVNDTVIVEIKAVAELAPVHEAQLLTYLRLTDRPVGLLMNFNVPMLKEGICRRVEPRDNNHNLRSSVSLS